MTMPPPLDSQTGDTGKLRYIRIGIGGLSLFASAVLLMMPLAYERPDMEQRVGTAMGSALCLLFGCGVLFGLPYVIRFGKAYLTLRQEHPGEPWMWREDWARGVVETGSPFKLAIPWIAGFYILFFSAPPLIRHGAALFRQPPDQLALALAGPAVGLLAMAGGLYLFLRWRRYGDSRLELVTQPGVIGGWFRANLRSRLHLGTSGRLLATLKCYYNSPSRGSQSGSRHLVWRQNQQVAASDATQLDNNASSIPLAFYIPYDCESTGRHRWELEVRARVTGPNYYACFRVPVFKTAESTVEVPQEAIDLHGDAVRPKQDHFEGSKARVNALPGGGLEVVTPTLNSKIAMLLLGCIAVFFGWLCYVYIVDRDIFIPGIVISGALCIVSAFLAAWAVLGRRRATIQEGTVQIRYEILRLGHAKSLPATAVTGVGHNTSARKNGRPYAHVYFQAGNRKSVVSSGLEPGEARWLSGVLKSYLEETAGARVRYLNETGWVENRS